MTTQEEHPWRAAIRTTFEALVALAASWALIVKAAGIDETLPWVASTLAFAAGLTRVMALPQVVAFVDRFLPFLSARPTNES